MQIHSDTPTVNSRPSPWLGGVTGFSGGVKFGDDDKDKNDKDKKAESKDTFVPARPNRLVKRLAQWKNRRDMAAQGLDVKISDADLKRLNALPEKAGIMLVANHTGNLDRQAMLELSRRWGRSFIAMGAKSAFDQMKPMERWIYQRLGVFSVGSGAEARPGRTYARQMLRAGKQVVVVFPEGEESYRTDGLLPLRYGAIKDILGVARHTRQPIVVLPVAMKYEYGEKLAETLSDSLEALEKETGLSTGQKDVKERYQALAAKGLSRLEKKYQLTDTEALPLPERLESFQENLVVSLEKSYGMINRFPDMPVRVERIANLINKRQPEPLAADVAAIRLLERLMIFPGGSLEPDADLASVAGGVSHLELLLLKKWPPSAMSAVKTIHISVQQPIDAKSLSRVHYRQPFMGIEELALQIREALLSGLGLA